MTLQNPVIGEVVAVVHIISVPPTPADSYLGVAEGMVRGAQLLAAIPNSPPHPLALLCCHALECILKAALSLYVNQRQLKGSDLRHNLAGLWELAAQHGLSVPVEPPIWLQGLSEMHDSPYQLRYAQGLNGMVFPRLVYIPDELRALLEQVRQMQREHRDLTRPPLPVQ